MSYAEKKLLGALLYRIGNLELPGDGRHAMGNSGVKLVVCPILSILSINILNNFG